MTIADCIAGADVPAPRTAAQVVHGVILAHDLLSDIAAGRWSLPATVRDRARRARDLMPTRAELPSVQIAVGMLLDAERLLSERPATEPPQP